MAVPDSTERTVVVGDLQYTVPYFVAPSEHPSHDWLTPLARRIVNLATGEVVKERTAPVAA